MAAALRLASDRLRHRRGDRLVLLITDGMPDDARAALDADRRFRQLAWMGFGDLVGGNTWRPNDKAAD